MKRFIIEIQDSVCFVRFKAVEAFVSKEIMIHIFLFEKEYCNSSPSFFIRLLYTMDVLLVTSDSETAQRVNDFFHRTTQKNTGLCRLEGFSGLFDELEHNRYDLVLLDVTTAEDGLFYVKKMRNETKSIPVFVIVDDEQPHTAQEALDLGAEKTLYKSRVLEDLLLGLGDYLRKGRKLQQQLSDAEKETRVEKELRQFYERVAGFSKTSVTEKSFSNGEEPDAFTEKMDQYAHRFADVLELALERQAYKVDYNISGVLRTMSEELGYYGVSPRDLVRIYSQALESKQKIRNKNKYTAYVEEGRMLLLEMMGYLASFYRRHSLGLINSKKVKRPPDTGEEQ